MNSLFLNLQNRLTVLSPGLIVVGTIAAAAGFLSLHYKAPVMLFALLIGIAFNFLSLFFVVCIPIPFEFLGGDFEFKIDVPMMNNLIL